MRKRDAPIGRLIFGKPSLSRVWCDECEEETLHRFGRCIHCTRQKREARWTSKPYGRDRAA